MAKRVTIQDIANALGISRNTVSKAINNSDGLAEDTRDRILQKAAEMGYKQFSYISMLSQNLSQAEGADRGRDLRGSFGFPDASSTAPGFNRPREIALFTRGFLGSSHFAHNMLDKFQRELSLLGCTLTIHRLTSKEISTFRLPPTFSRERTSGIVCVELFSYAYVKMLCDLGLPILLVDAPVEHIANPLPADLLLMDNSREIFRFIHNMVSTGVREIGFIGHVDHCFSFMERYLAFRNAMFFYGVPVREEFCITGNYQDKAFPAEGEYQKYLKGKLSSLGHLPQVFLCANDFSAMDVIAVCREVGISIPEDVMLCGFDDAPESRIVTPALTTVHIHSESMGLTAVQLLMSRLQSPELEFRTVHTESKLIYRDSAYIRE